MTANPDGGTEPPIPDGSPVDAGGETTDSGVPDAAVAQDAGDSGRADAGGFDAGVSDAAAADGSRDAGLSDASAADARPNVVFVTSERYVAGALGGLAGADGICETHATAAGLPGNFVAFLSTDSLRADERLSGARGWMRPDSLPVLDDVADVLTGKLYYPPILDENGAHAVMVTDSGTVWDDQDEVVTGYQRPAGAANNCANWTSTAEGDRAGIGVNNRGLARWAFEDTRRCAAALRIYCFEVGNYKRLQPSEFDGRLAFISRAQLLSSAGVAAFDAACSAEAAAAGFAGTFKALIARHGISAADRLSEGPRWQRPDGVVVFDSLAQMRTQPFPRAPVAMTASSHYGIDENGDPLPDAVWTGATSVTAPGTQESTCDNWQPNATGTPLGSSSSEGSRNWFSGKYSGDCSANQAARVYCFQE